MTQEQIEEYKKDPYYCPECGREDLIKTGDYWNDLKYNLGYKCNDCQFEWEEIYELATIRPIDEA